MVIKKLGMTKLLAVSLLSSTCSFAAVEGDFWNQASTEQLSTLMMAQKNLVSKAASPENMAQLEENTSTYFDQALKAENQEKQKAIFRQLSDYFDSFFKTVVGQNFEKSLGGTIDTDMKTKMISDELNAIHHRLQSQIADELRRIPEATTTTSTPVSDEPELPDFSAPPYVEVEKFDDAFYEERYQFDSRLAAISGEPALSREAFYNTVMAPNISRILKRKYADEQEKLARDREFREKLEAQRAKDAASQTQNRLWHGKLNTPEVQAALAYFNLDAQTAAFPLLASTYKKMAFKLAPDKLRNRLQRTPTQQEQDDATQDFQTFQTHYGVLKDAWENE